MYVTIMDFKGATRLFSDPDFDGEPVAVYEPKPDESVVPPDESDVGGTGEDEPPFYGAGNSDEEGAENSAGDDEADGSGAGGGTGRVKYIIDDIEVNLAVEQSQYLDAHGKLITESFRGSLKEQVKQSLMSEFRSLDDFLKRWNAAERKQVILDELSVQGVKLEVLQQAVANGEELDVFDLVTHVAFDQKPLTRRERANQVKKQDVFGRYGEQARAVLEALLEKFADHGIQDIEDSKILELPPFDTMGTKHQIRRKIFGGPERYQQAIQELEDALYKQQAG